MVWSDRLTGFGLRVRASGHKAWVVELTERGRLRVATPGPVTDVNARTARARARALLAGLPVKQAAGHGKGGLLPTGREQGVEKRGKLGVAERLG